MIRRAFLARIGGGVIAAALLPGAFPRPAGAQRGVPRPLSPRQTVPSGFTPRTITPIRPTQPPLSDGARLLMRMVQAERSTAYIAREATLRADGAGSENIVKSDPRRGVRREPASGRGRVMLTDFRQVYRFTPGRNDLQVEVAPNASRSPLTGLGQWARRLQNGGLVADVVGTDTVAGRAAYIVEVRANDMPGPTRRFWTDQDTGLRLRTEEKDTNGKVLSGSYYTTLDLNPQFVESDFAPPSPQSPADGTARPTPPRGRRQFASLAEARRAGVPFGEPGYVPPGYALRQVEVTDGNGHVALRYANGLNALSVTTLPNGVPAKVRLFLGADGTAVVPFPQGRTGLFVETHGKMAYLLLGDLPEAELRRIAASLR